MKWIRTASLKEYDVISAFEEFDSLYWKKASFGIEEGDTVYIYVGKPISKIMYETVCIKDDGLSTDSEGQKDIKYWKKEYEPREAYSCVELKLIGVNNRNDLAINQLKEMPLVEGNIQGAYKESKYPELFQHINTIFERERNKEDWNGIVNGIEMNLPDEIQGKERDCIIKVRINQGYFRDRLLDKYGKCCLCGVSDTRFLVASHIKPWADSTPSEKVDVENGLLLCPNHDKLFDLGMITFDNDGKIIVSEGVSDNDRIYMNVSDRMFLSMSNKMKKYMHYHRENVFSNGSKLPEG